MDKFIIYKRPGCVWCDRALDIIDQRGYPYEIRDIAAVNDHLQHLVSHGFKTVPQIYHGDRHIGGHDDLVLYLNTLK